MKEDTKQTILRALDAMAYAMNQDFAKLRKDFDVTKSKYAQMALEHYQENYDYQLSKTEAKHLDKLIALAQTYQNDSDDIDIENQF